MSVSLTLSFAGAVSPHTYSLRPSDAAALEDADLIFMIDPGLETSFARAIANIAPDSHVVQLSTTEHLVRRPLREGGAFEWEDGHDHHGDKHDAHDHEDEHDTPIGSDDHAQDDHGDTREEPFDLHIWLDPENASAMVDSILAALTDADPANASTYESNARALQRDLAEFGAALAADLAPARDIPFVVFHDAYRYFEDRFGLTPAGSVVVNPTQPPSVQRIREIRAKIGTLGVACVFDEPQFNRSVVDTIIEDLPVGTGTLDPLGATIADGPELYFTLLSNMAATFRHCLSPDNNG